MRAASTWLRAISLGVFWRCEPSTRAIIRSRKLSPNAAVIRTTIRSESTLVPPVTADRSPPDSRMTGADSPVIADSSTLATPSTTSPSPGMIWPASTTTRSPTRSVVPGTSSSVPSADKRRAIVSVRVRRSAAAWARPRPSATASARLANSTVSHSHPAMPTLNTLGSRTASSVVAIEPIQTTNMTGVCHWWAGFSLRSASGMPDASWAGENGLLVVVVLTRGPPRWGTAPGRGRRSAGRR